MDCEVIVPLLRLTGTLFRSYYGVREGDQGGVFRNFCSFFVLGLGAETRLGNRDDLLCFIMGLWGVGMIAFNPFGC